MNLGSIHIDGRLVLAPMAGVTDLAFRTICARLGATVTVTEMVSSRALVYQDKKSVTLLKPNEGSVVGAQIFGNDAEIMAQGAALAVSHSGCDFVDINMGCPVGKICNNGDGSALMRDEILAEEIVRAVVSAVKVPVTVKFRKGWDKGSVNAVSFAKAMERAGAAAVAVHGRTKSMMYSGVADWDIIHQVKLAVGIPVIANGDVVSAEAALRCLEQTGADGVMVGRGAFGDPWIFQQILAALDGKDVPSPPPLAERVDTALEQFVMAREDKGEYIACLEARKHFAWYLRGVSHGNYYKDKISQISSMEEIFTIAKGIKRDLR